MASSRYDEHSYATKNVPLMGVSLADRFTSSTLRFFEASNIGTGSSSSHSRDTKKIASIKDLFASYKRSDLMSTATPRIDLYNRDLNNVPVTDFFGSVLNIDLNVKGYPFQVKKSLNFPLEREKDITDLKETIPKSAEEKCGKLQFNESLHVVLFIIVTVIILHVKESISGCSSEQSYKIKLKID